MLISKDYKNNIFIGGTVISGSIGNTTITFCNVDFKKNRVAKAVALIAATILAAGISQLFIPVLSLPTAISLIKIGSIALVASLALTALPTKKD